MAQKVGVFGLEQPDEDKLWDSHLVVNRDGEITDVPVTLVSPTFYSGSGNGMPVVSYDRVFISEGRIGAELRKEDGTIYEMREVVAGSEDFEAKHETAPPVEYTRKELWRRPGREANELGNLVSCGLSPAEALDYWMIEFEGHNVTGWANRRGRSHQAISENVRKARSKFAPE